MDPSASVIRRPERHQASRRWWATVFAILTAGAAGAACTGPEIPEATPTATRLTVQPTVVPPPTGSGEQFVVPPFDGPDPKPVVDGTTHRYVNPHAGAGMSGPPVPSDYLWLEYSIPAGWEVGDVYIGKNLGEPNEVALSFWTTAGVYGDPCRRSARLSPLDLADHGHPDDAGISLGSYPELGLSAQNGREASEPRSVVIGDPTYDEGTIAVRFELTVPADLDLTACDDGAYRAWPGFDVGDQPNDNHVAGQTDIIFQVDVDRNPLIIDASFRPDSSPEDVDELNSVIGSIVMDRW